MVEFALVAPIVLVLVFGALDLGRAAYHQNQLTNAAREGARVAVLADHPCNTIAGSAVSGACPTTGVAGETSVCAAILAEGSLIPTASWHCSEGGTLPSPAAAVAGNAYVEVDQFPNSSTPCPGSPTTPVTTTPRQSGNWSVKVTIDYYFRPWTPVLGTLFPSTFHLEATACARAEY